VWQSLWWGQYVGFMETSPPCLDPLLRGGRRLQQINGAEATHFL
jgi:hypothetical protein